MSNNNLDIYGPEIRPNPLSHKIKQGIKLFGFSK
jgi:hypothetical protein